MILRELIAKLTLDMDRKGFDVADKQISGLTRGLNFAGGAAIALGAALSAGVGVLTARAADASETLNLMGIVFEQNRQDVMAWADSFGRATGRSVFELRDVSTTFGNLVKGMVGDLDLATDMAQRLSERAVDFGSALNINLTDAAEKFRAALSGEVEPLRRFGINMTTAALQAYALEEGISANVGKMSEAEKATLRYSFLMDKTAEFQGDAAKTSEGYANASKALMASLGDLGTRIGMKFLPAAESTIRVVRDVVDTLGGWLEKSNIVQAALLVFGAIGTAVALRMAAAWALANLPILLAAVALAALVLIVDDFMTFLDGGDSLIGRFIDSIWGPGSASEAVLALKDAFRQLCDFWTDMFLPAVSDVMSSAGQAIGDFFSGIGEWVIRNEAALLDWSEGVKAIFAGVGDAIKAMFDGLIDGAKTAWEYLGKISDAATKFGSMLGFEIAGSAGAAHSSVRAPQRGLPSIATPQAAQAAAMSSAPNQSIQQSVSVTVEGNATPETARKVANDSAEAIKRMNRHARAGLTQRAAT